MCHGSANAVRKMDECNISYLDVLVMWVWSSVVWAHHSSVHREHCLERTKPIPIDAHTGSQNINYSP